MAPLQSNIILYFPLNNNSSFATEFGSGDKPQI